MIPRLSFSSSIFLRLLIVIISALLVVLFLPHERSMNYDYGVGRPWKYGEIIAEYDFPIYKSEEAIKEETDSVMRSFMPYYILDATIGKAQILDFRQDAQNGKLGDVPANYIRYIEQQLEEVYNIGILESQDFTSLGDSGYYGIRIEQERKATPRLIKEVYTTRSAYQHIFAMADSITIHKDILSRCNINNYLDANLKLDKHKTIAEHHDLLSSISYASGMVQKGEKIVDRGDIVTPQIVSILESMDREEEMLHGEQDSDWRKIAGKWLICAMLMYVMMAYLTFYKGDSLKGVRTVSLLFFLLVLFPIVTSLVAQSNVQNVFMVPIPMVAIFVSVFLDSRTAFITHFLAVIMSSMALQDPFVFCISQMIAGFVGIFSLKQLDSRSKIIQSAFIVVAVTELFMMGLQFSQGLDIEMFDRSMFVNEAINGVLLLFAYPFLFVMEKIFGFTSPITLIELSNANHPLLSQLSKEAPGTFNHAVQVSNLASEVAKELGADTMLVRTGALYHDIGKLKNPIYFTENQSGVNPHNQLSEERSAQIIIEHVNNGLELASQYGLPKIVKEFIATHHGESKASYFYVKYKNAHPNEEIDEQLFTYPGPNPSTREQAILMLADSVEAASKSLKEINDDSISTLVNNIIDGKMKEGLLENTPLTFRDVQITKEVLINGLKTIYHTRVSYPTLNKPTKKNKQHHRFFRGNN